MTSDLARDLAQCEAQIFRCESELRNPANKDIDGAGLGLHDWAGERRLILAEAERASMNAKEIAEIREEIMAAEKNSPLGLCRNRPLLPLCTEVDRLRDELELMTMNYNAADRERNVRATEIDEQRRQIAELERRNVTANEHIGLLARQKDDALSDGRINSRNLIKSIVEHDAENSRLTVRSELAEAQNAAIQRQNNLLFEEKIALLRNAVTLTARAEAAELARDEAVKHYHAAIELEGPQRYATLLDERDIIAGKLEAAKRQNAAMREALEALSRGHYEAVVRNPYRREDNCQWGDFHTEEEARIAAERCADGCNDTAASGHAEFVTDLGGNGAHALVSRALAALNLPATPCDPDAETGTADDQLPPGFASAAVPAIDMMEALRQSLLAREKVLNAAPEPIIPPSC